LAGISGSAPLATPTPPNWPEHLPLPILTDYKPRLLINCKPRASFPLTSFIFITPCCKGCYNIIIYSPLACQNLLFLPSRQINLLCLYLTPHQSSCKAATSVRNVLQVRPLFHSNRHPSANLLNSNRKSSIENRKLKRGSKWDAFLRLPFRGLRETSFSAFLSGGLRGTPYPPLHFTPMPMGLGRKHEECLKFSPPIYWVGYLLLRNQQYGFS